MHCTARGSLPLTYTWLHAGDQLQEYNGPDLVIEQVKPSDAGKYECHVANLFGGDFSTITIKVGESVLPIYHIEQKVLHSFLHAVIFLLS